MDWTKPMSQSFEYYKVDPSTWKDSEKLTNVKSCTITRSSDSSTLESASFEINGEIEECYIRVYLIAKQKLSTIEIQKIPLGTFLVSSVSSDFDGLTYSKNVDAYSPLIELSEKIPDIGYWLPKKSNILGTACSIIEESMRAPLIRTTSDEIINYNFASNANDTWLTFLSDFLSYSDYSLSLDHYGRVLFKKRVTKEEAYPVWEFSDDDASIMYPQISLDKDLYSIPNVVEVVYTNTDGSYLQTKIKNTKADSITSIDSRGREIMYRDSDPSFNGDPSIQEFMDYANNLMESLSTVTCELTFDHGYCPVELGDYISFNYNSAGLTGIKAKVVSQTIDCSIGCKVSETVRFYQTYWEA